MKNQKEYTVAEIYEEYPPDSWYVKQLTRIISVCDCESIEVDLKAGVTLTFIKQNESEKFLLVDGWKWTNSA